MKQPTTAQFNRALRAVIDRDNEKASQILSVPGIYEILSEYYNNDTLDYLRWDHETNETED